MGAGAAGLHAGGPLLTGGAPAASARAAVILFHGRGATAESILDLAREFDADGVAFFAPQAANNTWYPQSFLAPLAANEPWLTSALERAGETVAEVVRLGIPHERITLLGFSQGACLALEYAARHARRYAGVVGLSGGLIGPAGTPRDYRGSLDGTPVFLGCSDVDFHIPLARVKETGEMLRALGGDVTVRIYPNMGHTVNEDELAWVRTLLQG